MFELEVNHATYTKSQIPIEILQAFSSNLPIYPAVSVFQWEEHCTECAMPQCYSTCDLYESRNDGKCRRFTEGIATINDLAHKNGIVKITFKKWGSLMATGYLEIVDSETADHTEKNALKAAKIANTVPDDKLSILGRRSISSRMARRYKRKTLEKTIINSDTSLTPDFFLLELYNPNDYQIDFTFVIRAIEGEKNTTPYQKLLKLDPGFHQIKIDYEDIRNFVSPKIKHFVSITPNFSSDEQAPIAVYIGDLGFKKDIIDNSNKATTNSIKIAIWDLDNTIWNGTLIEDNLSKLELMPNIKNVLETLDQRGIVNSVASKNNHQDAWKQLQEFGLEHLIVFPKINWGPKSQSIKSIIDDFNVGNDTIAFIDDSPFEREEVHSSIPQVRVYDAIDYMDLLQLPEFSPKQSTESSRRREFYKNQKIRKEAVEKFSGDYLKFVASCDIKISIIKAQSNNIDRIQELVQRTNQMNFTGNRYSQKEISDLINNPNLDNYCITCKDKFGDYGTVGFCIVDAKTPQLSDLMFSCRIQSKRVEHAFLSWLLHTTRDKGSVKFSAIYNKTEKNTPVGAVFDDLGFSVVSNTNNNMIYSFDLSKNIPWDNLISIDYEGQEWQP
jgi:FkbH-like protein